MIWKGAQTSFLPLRLTGQGLRMTGNVLGLMPLVGVLYHNARN